MRNYEGRSPVVLDPNNTEIDSGHGRIETKTCQLILIGTSGLSKAYPWYISSLGFNVKPALHAVLKFNMLRKIALNLFKQDNTKSASITRKRKCQNK